MKKFLFLFTCVLAILIFPIQGEARFQLSNLRTTNDFSLKTIDGNEIQMSDLKGKPFIINFFTTWCPSCKEELPELIKFQTKYGKENYLLSINYTSFEIGGTEKINNFVKKNKINFPVLLDHSGVVGKKFEVITIPTTFFFDSSGNVVKKNVGPTTFVDLEEFILENK